MVLHQHKRLRVLVVSVYLTSDYELIKWIGLDQTWGVKNIGFIFQKHVQKMLL